jgi:hypothetical protein
MAAGLGCGCGKFCDDFLAADLRMTEGMFDDFSRERRIRRCLKTLARQRVALVAQPDNVWVVENSPEFDDDMQGRLAHVPNSWLG